MRVFLTGASGHIGSAVTQELLTSGHTVVGLARSDSAAAKLASAGAEVQRGDLDDLACLKQAAAAADGVIHLAFKHDLAFSGEFEAAADADRRAIETVGDALAGSDRPFLIASGVAGLTPGRLATERDGHDPSASSVYGRGFQTRHANAEMVLGFAARNIRSAIVRIAPTCHGEGDRHGFVPRLVAIARSKGVSAYIGDGSNHWPAVHLLDAARLFRLGIEKAPAGSTLHAVADEGVSLRDIAAAIGRKLNVPMTGILAEEAATHFGPMASFVGIDCRASSALTQRLLGWTPVQPGLLEDLAAEHYFEVQPPAAA